MGEGVEVWRGSVAAWECDVMGHLNVGFYIAKSMEALAGFAAELGMADAFAADARSTLIVREHHIRFIREARAGAPLSITGGVLELGDSDARLLLVMRHGGGQLAASFQVRVSHATAGEAREFPWPPHLRERARALQIDLPPDASPRSIGIAPVASAAGRERAIALGLRRSALGAIGRDDCDLFGRMRTERLIARIVDGNAQNRADADEPGRRIGTAALEYRLIYLAWPRVGDRVELWSGASGGDARFRRLIHWLVDPATGQALGVAEAVIVAFDLETRKIIRLSPAALARADAQVIPGLTL